MTHTKTTFTLLTIFFILTNVIFFIAGCQEPSTDSQNAVAHEVTKLPVSKNSLAYHLVSDADYQINLPKLGNYLHSTAARHDNTIITVGNYIESTDEAGHYNTGDTLYILLADTNFNVKGRYPYATSIFDGPVHPALFASSKTDKKLLYMQEYNDYCPYGTFYLIEDSNITEIGLAPFLGKLQEINAHDSMQIIEANDTILFTYNLDTVYYNSNYYSGWRKYAGNDINMQYDLKSKAFSYFYKGQKVTKSMVPFLPNKVSTKNEILSENLKLIDSLSGDLNYDGIDDFAVILQTQNKDFIPYPSDPNVDLNPRTLCIYFKTGEGYKKQVQSDNFIPIKDNPYLDEPFDGMLISNDSLILSFRYWLSAGSYVVTTEKTTFTFNGENFEKIGFQNVTSRRNTGEYVRSTYDFRNKTWNQYKENMFYSQEEEPNDFGDTTRTLRQSQIFYLENL